MATKKLGNLIKTARTNAGLTQAALAEKVDNCSASDISKAERAEKDLTQEQLKQIAKACGVTQKSLLEAAGKSSSSKTSSSGSAKNSSSKTNSSKNSGSKTSSGTSVKVTATEKKLLEFYRAADSQTKKAALAILKGDTAVDQGILSDVINIATSNNSILKELFDNIMSGK